MQETNPVRPGEELDIGRLSVFLASHLNIPVDDIAVEQFPAGSSNLTYLVGVGDQEYVLRRPPFGNTVKSAHDMNREFGVLSKLSSVYAPAPKPLLLCDDESIIGSEFYLMERRHGLVIRGSLDGVSSPHISKGSAGDPQCLEESGQFRIDVCFGFIQNLADLHSLDAKHADLETLGKPEGYNRRQVEGWTKRYFAAKTDEHAELESAISWLNDNIPPEFGASLIHNDYKFDNVMLDPEDITRVTAVLDWEMVTLGDPLMDLGTTLGYWMSKDAPEWLLEMPFNPRILMENVTRQELVEMYCKALGRAVPDMVFYYAFGTFKIAVICQQIYARYVKGLTKDPRFADFDKFVQALGRIAAGALERGTI